MEPPPPARWLLQRMNEQLEAIQADVARLKRDS
jgi:hypothetical protein